MTEMHANVIASHDRARLHRGERTEVMLDDNFVCLADSFCIISLRDAHGMSFSYSEAHLATLRGYDFFVKATIDETLNPFALEGEEQ